MLCALDKNKALTPAEGEYGPLIISALADTHGDDDIRTHRNSKVFMNAVQMTAKTERPELSAETRVVIVDSNRVEELDFESRHKRQLRGNVYLARVTRVEPSLQAAFIEYGGNRHGFLAFSEIHPDYYRIPEADKKALKEQEEEDQRKADEEDEKRKAASSKRKSRYSKKKDEDEDEELDADALDAEDESEEEDHDDDEDERDENLDPDEDDATDEHDAEIKATKPLRQRLISSICLCRATPKT